MGKEVKEAQEALNCWQRTEEKTFKVLLFTKLIVCLLLILVMWFIYSYQFFAPRTTQTISHFFTLFFLAVFLLALLINTITVIFRYRR